MVIFILSCMVSYQVSISLLVNISPRLSTALTRLTQNYHCHLPTSLKNELHRLLFFAKAKNSLKFLMPPFQRANIMNSLFQAYWITWTMLPKLFPLPSHLVFSPLTFSLPFVERKLQIEALYTKYQIYRAALSGDRGRRVCTETCSLLLVPQKPEQSVKEFKDQRGRSTNLNLLNTKIETQRDLLMVSQLISDTV